MQPAYLPWAGYFDRVRRSDVHIVLDHVAMDENSRTKFANRNRIRAPEGWAWLTVPVRSKGLHGRLVLRDVEISGDGGWRSKHWGALRANYSRAPFFKDFSEFFAEVYSREWERLAELNHVITRRLLDWLGITTETRFSSEMGAGGVGNELILNLCREVGAATYLSGPFGREYLDAEAFRAAGIEVLVHTFCMPAHEQCFPGWEPNLSVVDALFNLGPERARQLIEDGGILEKL